MESGKERIASTWLSSDRHTHAVLYALSHTHHKHTHTHRHTQITIIITILVILKIFEVTVELGGTGLYSNCSEGQGKTNTGSNAA